MDQGCGIADSASDRATPSSCWSAYWATWTTTARGPDGAISSGRRSSAPLCNASERKLTMTTNRVVRADQDQRRREQGAGVDVRIAAYKLGNRCASAGD